MLKSLQGKVEESADSGGCEIGEPANALNVQNGFLDVRVRVTTIAQKQEIAEELGVMSQGLRLRLQMAASVPAKMYFRVKNSIIHAKKLLLSRWRRGFGDSFTLILVTFSDITSKYASLSISHSSTIAARE